MPAKTQSAAASCGLSGAAAIAALLAASAVPAAASTDLPAVCEAAAAEASERTGVPLSVLKAISLTETGRKWRGELRPWPWTVNMEGAGHWFDSRDDALAYAYREYKRGARSFDVGCFQINYKYHGDAFGSIEEMFDPLANALYAAGFLGRLYAESGSWSVAAGAYHSRTPKYAERYRARFDRFRTALAAEDGRQGDGETADNAPDFALAGTPSGEIPEIPDIVLAANGGEPAPAAPRVNTFPLLQQGRTAGLGSLVPLGRGAPLPEG